MDTHRYGQLAKAGIRSCLREGWDRRNALHPATQLRKSADPRPLPDHLCSCGPSPLSRNDAQTLCPCDCRFGPIDSHRSRAGHSGSAGGTTREPVGAVRYGIGSGTDIASVGTQAWEAFYRHSRTLADLFVTSLILACHAGLSDRHNSVNRTSEKVAGVRKGERPVLGFRALGAGV